MATSPVQHLYRACALSAGVLAALYAQNSLARDQLYGVIDNKALLQCESEHWSGQLANADTCYKSLLADGSQSLLIRAEAVWAMGDLQAANTFFQQAIKAEPDNPLVRIRWGELFMQTYQYQEAFNLFKEALDIDPDNAWAHLGAAQALQQGDDAKAVEAHMEEAEKQFLTVPGVHLRALIMQIRNQLEQDHYDKAEETLQKALKVANDNDLSPLELYALQAAHAFMTLKPYQSYIDAALKLDPHYGGAYAIPGYFASITRRYRESADFYQQAVDIEPDNWTAHLELGQNYLRMNQVTPAIDEVSKAFSGDAFNPKTVNLMRLLQTFTNDMETVSFPDPPQGAFPKLILRMDKTETGILKDYADELAEKSMDLYSKRFGFTLKAPVVVEIYPNHEDFVVRSIGMPGVGILGVTFGYLIAMDSPTAHGRGDSYHWGTTLWHEMAHVFTLEMTNHLIPRWFSEGVSVFEEWKTGPIPGRKIPNNVYQAMSEGKFLPIEDLDDGFMRPTYNDQVIVSYMEAGLVFDFIDSEYGFDKIVAILNQFKDGTKAPAAMEKALGISMKELDKHFEQWIQVEYGQFLQRLPAWQEDQKAAFAALDEEKWQDAVDAATRANFAYPDYVEVDSPYIAMARAYQRLDDKENEFKTLETFWKKGGYEPRALLALAQRYHDRGDDDSAMQVYQDAIWSDPFMKDVHSGLGDLYLSKGEAHKALKEYLVLLALKPIDKADANLRVARAYKALQDHDKTMQYLMTALDIAPQYRPAQQLLLEMSKSE